MAKFINEKMDIIIATFGAGGGNELIDFLSKYKKVNSSLDLDGFKHLALPPVSFNPNMKMIYIWESPIKSVVSIFRRGLQERMSLRMQHYNKIFYKILTSKTSLEQYANEGIDRFLFERNYKNWHHDYIVCPTLFIRLSRMWDNLDAIFDFVGIPRSDRNKFPPKHDTWSYSVDEKIKKNLVIMYQSQEVFFNSCPDIEIIFQKSIKNIFFRKNYFLALLTLIYELVRDPIRKYLPAFYDDIKNVSRFFLGRKSRGKK